MALIHVDLALALVLWGPRVTDDHSPGRQAHWTFLTNHAHVLLCVARNPEIRIRDVALLVGITERAAQRIVADLVDGAYLERTRVGRRNQYRVCVDRTLRHPVEQQIQVGDLVALLLSTNKPV